MTNESATETLSEMLADDTVIDCVPNPDGTMLVFAEEMGPAPDAVAVFADHTDDYDVETVEYTERPGQRAYKVSPA